MNNSFLGLHLQQYYEAAVAMAPLALSWSKCSAEDFYGARVFTRDKAS